MTDVLNQLVVPDPPRGRSASVSSRRASLSSQLRYSSNLSDGDSEDDEDVSLLAFVVDEMMSVRLGVSPALSTRNPPPKSSVPVFDSIPVTPFRDFLRIPLQVERFLVYATLNCWNLVLYDLTFGPLQVGVPAYDYPYPFQAARSFVLLLKAVAWLTKKRVRMCGSRLYAACKISSWLRSPRISSSPEPELDQSEIEALLDPLDTRPDGTMRTEGLPRCPTRPMMVDFLRVSVIVIGVVFFQYLDLSVLYHYVRAQSFMKLYVINNIVEIVERMWRSLGVDLHYELCRSADAFNLSLRKNIVEAGEPNIVPSLIFLMSTSLSIMSAADAQEPSSLPWPAPHKPIWIFLLLPAILLHTMIHIVLHLLRILLTNIAIHSSDSMMFIIIINSHLGEIKSTVFKKFTPVSLHVIAAYDAVQRFQIILDSILVWIHVAQSESQAFSLGTYWFVIINLAHFFSWVTFMWAVEVMVDWMKHSFLGKFQSVKAKDFKQFYLAQMADVVFSRTVMPSGVWSPPCRGVCNFALIPVTRLGFCSLPFSTLILGFLLPSLQCSADALPNVLLACKVLVGWMALVSLKILLSIILVHFAVCYKDMVEAQLLPRSRDLRAL